jgi:glycosyltransferase involved in cell wall biosynthesis
LSRILILGHAPLPWEDTTRSYGPGTRTWQFAKPLVGDGHEVTILASRIPFVYPEETGPVLARKEQGCTVYRVSQDEFEVGGVTDRLMGEVDPDCVIGATAYPSYVALNYAGERPVWADVFGSLLAEAQAKAAVYDNDYLLDHFARMNRSIILKADRFSTVSGPQKNELIGQLGVFSRLKVSTFGYDFVRSIPCGVQDREFPPPADPFTGRENGDFIVLWSGGFNTWTDVETLYGGMRMAMSRSPRVHFVSTGGEIEGHDEKTYRKFVGLVEASEYRDRFHLKGWVKRSRALSHYGASSVGVNIDARHYEVVFGSRNRILEWAIAGLPSISTDLCELTGQLAAEGLLFPVPAGNPGALSDRVIELQEDPEKLASAGRRLRKYVLDTYSFEETTRELRNWADRPEHSPDFPEVLNLRLKDLEGIRKMSKPLITPDSPWTRKMSFYLKSEGPLRTLKRASSFVGRKAGRG